MDDNVQKLASELTALALAALTASFVLAAVSWKLFESSLKRLTNSEIKTVVKRLLFANLSLVALYAGYTVARIFWPDKVTETGFLFFLSFLLLLGVYKGVHWLLRWVKEARGFPVKPMPKLDPDFRAFFHLQALVLVCFGIICITASLVWSVGFAVDLESSRNLHDSFRWAQFIFADGIAILATSMLAFGWSYILDIIHLWGKRD